MESIEYHPIGEVFECLGQKIKAAKAYDGCCGCVFYQDNSFCMVSGSCLFNGWKCLSDEREDGLSVIYVPAEEEQLKTKIWKQKSMLISLSKKI